MYSCPQTTGWREKHHSCHPSLGRCRYSEGFPCTCPSLDGRSIILIKVIWTLRERCSYVFFTPSRSLRARINTPCRSLWARIHTPSHRLWNGAGIFQPSVHRLLLRQHNVLFVQENAVAYFLISEQKYCRKCNITDIRNKLPGY